MAVARIAGTSQVGKAIPRRTLADIDRLARTEPPWRDNSSSWRDRVDAEVIRQAG
jgi:hypothetical protein